MIRLDRLVLLASLPLAALCLLSVTSRWWFPGDLAANSSLHAAVLLWPALVLWRRSPWVAGSLLLCLIIGASPWLRAAWEPHAALPVSGRPSIPVASANMYLYNQERPAALASVLAQGAKIVVLAESIASDDRPRVPVERYPYQLWQPQLDRKWHDCVALLSAYPILFQQVCDLDQQPYLAATLDVDGRPLHVIAVHTTSPESPSRYSDRNLQLEHIASTVKQLQATLQAPVLLMGDWNLTVGSAAWRDLRKDAGVRRAAQHEPASWPWFLGPAGITIDHILGCGLALGPQHAFVVTGSDHRGLSGSIQLP